MKWRSGVTCALKIGNWMFGSLRFGHRPRAVLVVEASSFCRSPVPQTAAWA